MHVLYDEGFSLKKQAQICAEGCEGGSPAIIMLYTLITTNSLSTVE